MPSVRFQGGYVQAGFVLTGENHKYNPGTASYGGIVPNNPFSLTGGGWGAWEVAARASTISKANAAVGALPTSTRMNSRSGAGQPIASEVMWTRARIAARMATAKPAPVRINPNCR